MLSKCNKPGCELVYYWLTGNTEGHKACEETCRFFQGKQGEGDPAMPSQDFLEGYRNGVHDHEN